MAHYVIPCPLMCGHKAKYEDAGDRRLFECAVCGKFSATGTALSTKLGRLSATQQDLLPYLRAHIRQLNTTGTNLEIDSTTDWEHLARLHRGTPVQRRQIWLLETIGAADSIPGRFISLDLESAAPLLDAYDKHEVQFHVGALQKSGLLETRYVRDPSGGRDSQGGFTEPDRPEYRITPEGWQVLQPIGGFQPGSCFVAMAFADELNSAFTDGIAAAVRACGFGPMRVDRIQHNESINDRIIVGIRTAQFGIADVTLQRNGVYFEGGYAMGLGRPVIWMVREDDTKNVHFDTSHFNLVVWKNEHDLREKLTARIRGTIPGAKLTQN